MCVSVSVRLSVWHVVPPVQQQESCPLELSDDEDLREQMDMHSIIVSCISNEPLFTAEQVHTHT